MTEKERKLEGGVKAQRVSAESMRERERGTRSETKKVETARQRKGNERKRGDRERERQRERRGEKVRGEIMEEGEEEGETEERMRGENQAMLMLADSNEDNIRGWRVGQRMLCYRQGLSLVTTILFNKRTYTCTHTGYKARTYHHA